ncbi:MAG: porin family protein [Pseudomonadota bacterium]|nr:porin family protein [Pseudomonadota bacterium]
MKKTLSLCLLACSALSTTAFAESDLYVSGGYSLIDGQGVTPNTFTARAGGSFNDYFGIEVEGAFGGEPDTPDGLAGVEISVESQIGGYLVGKYPVSERFDVRARIGYAEWEFEGDFNGVIESATIDGFAAGVGGEFMISENFGLIGDVTHYEAEGGLDFDEGFQTFTFGGILKFGISNAE